MSILLLLLFWGYYNIIDIFIMFCIFWNNRKVLSILRVLKKDYFHVIF